MTSKDNPRFDLYTIEALAGDRVFARGEAYFRSGAVDIQGIEPGRVLARVVGTDDYRIVMTGQGTAVGGECSCPAFEREGFCKHMVAVALAANAAAGCEDGSGGVLARVRDYLRTKDIEALVEMVMDMAERDPGMFGRLEIAAVAAGADDKTFESQMRVAVRDATRTRGFVDYARAPAWAAGVTAALDLLAETASGPRAPLVTELADYAISRIERAIEDIDDSDGYCLALLAHAQRVHLDACRTARPDPVELARDLYSRETQSDYDTFRDAVVEYADILGEEGLAEYRRLAEEAWEELPARIGPRRGQDDRYGDLQVASILDFFAERDGDVDQRIALRAKNLSSQGAYLQLVEFCLAHGREKAALRRAEEGLWLFEDERPDERLVLFTADLLLKSGRSAEAEAHLWRAFEKQPTLSLYGRLRALGGEPAAQRAIGHLQQKLEGAPSSAPWSFPADLLITIMMEEEMIEAAWDVVRDRGASRSVKEALARASETTHADRAIAVYEERVEELAAVGGTPGYQEAAALVTRMGALRGEAEQRAYLAELKERHRRKRNLMKLLG